MNAYSGEEPYVFVSYCHNDWNAVEAIIVGLKRKMCRVWYDEGLSIGESWNDDLANHISNSASMIVLLTENSVKSRYVIAEINFAILHNKTIVPINMDNCDLPPGVELMLGHIQIASPNNTDTRDYIDIIASNLPEEVFASKKVPFYEAEGYRFFLEKYSVPNLSSQHDTASDAFSIVCRDNDEHKNILFDFKAIPAYEVEYKVTQCKEIKDDYFVGKINGIVIFNVLADCCLNYPLSGPDLDVLMIFVLRIAEDSIPTVRMIDYQNMHIVQSSSTEGKKIIESPWGQAIEKICKDKLYQ